MDNVLATSSGWRTSISDFKVVSQVGSFGSAGNNALMGCRLVLSVSLCRIQESKASYECDSELPAFKEA
jgi:hypothetical protein